MMVEMMMMIMIMIMMMIIIITLRQNSAFFQMSALSVDPLPENPARCFYCFMDFPHTSSVTTWFPVLPFTSSVLLTASS